MPQASMWTPKPWLAAVLGAVWQPAGMLYGAAPRWAVGYYFAALALGIVALVFSSQPAVALSLKILLVTVCAVHAYRNAKRYQPVARRPWHSRLPAIVLLYVLMFVPLLMFRAFLYEPFRFPSMSMMPTIPRGAHLMASKWGYGNYQAFGVPLLRSAISSPLRRGDLVVFAYPIEPEIPYVKRLIGFPGDHVVYKNKVLSIIGIAIKREDQGSQFDENKLRYLKIFRETLDGRSYLTLLDESAPAALQQVLPFPDKELCQYDASGFSCKVPLQSYFVLGYNRDSSFDSRHWGFVPAANIIGVVNHVF